ncbi:MAG: hypothetical protein ACM3MK_00825, partial [Chitinophagales bacterium]
MSSDTINPKAILLVRLSEDDLSYLVEFNSEDTEIDLFLKQEALKEQSNGLNSTILLYYAGKLAGYCSICCDSISLTREEREQDELNYYRIPAIKIARLGRDIKFKNHGFGAFLIDYIKDVAFELC